MLKDAASWGIRNITADLDSGTSPGLSAKECHRRSSSLCLSTGILPKELLSFTKGSRPVVPPRGNSPALVAARHTENRTEHEKHAEVYVGKGQEPER